MNLHHRLGNLADYVAPKFIELAVESVKSYECPTAYMAEKIVNSWKSMGGHRRYTLAIKYYLLDELEPANEQWVKLPCDVAEYFFGDWRMSFKREKTGGVSGYWKQCEWMRLYENGLVACAVTGQWELARRLSAYPDADCGQDVDTKPEDRTFLLALAEWMRSGNLSQSGERWLSSAESGKSKRAKEEAKLLRATQRGEAGECTEVLACYLKYYRRHIFTLNDVTEKQSKMGTFFWQWWVEKGLRIEVAAADRDYLISLKTK